MKISGLYYGREALSSFRKNLVQSIAAVTTVALCLVVVGVIMLALFMGGQMIKKVEQKVEIEVYLEGLEQTSVLAGTNSGGYSGASYRRVEQFQSDITSWPEIRRVQYISKEKALKEFKSDFKDQPDVVRNISGNPLPASFRISLKNPRDVSKVAGRIKALPYVKDLVGDMNRNVEYGKETVRKLFALTRWVSMAAAGFTFLLMFVSLVLITNTIRLAIFARRKEIGIMRLVGASNWFIRWPFLLEGMLQGIIGAGLAVAALLGLWRTVFTNLAEGKIVAFLAVPLDQAMFVKLVVLLIIGGMLIGAAGSAIALRRFLKV